MHQLCYHGLLEIFMNFQFKHMMMLEQISPEDILFAFARKSKEKVFPFSEISRKDVLTNCK